MSWPARGRPWLWFWPFQIDRPCWAVKGGLALSWPARGRPWPWFWPFQIDRPCWAVKGVWPCPGPRVGGLGLGFGPSRSTGPVGQSRGSGLVLARAWAALALVLALPDRPALLGRQGGLALSWPARGRPWPWFWPFQIDRPCWAVKGVWPCPGPRVGGLGLGFGPSRSTGSVGQSRGSGLVLARAWAALALVLALPDRPALLGSQGGLALSWPARGRPWPWFWPFQIDRPCWALKGVWPCPGPRVGGLGFGFGPSRSTGPVGQSRGVWPCPGPRVGGLGLGFGPSRSTGPVGQSRGSGLVLARAWAALALVLALPDRPACFLSFFNVFQGLFRVFNPQF